MKSFFTATLLAMTLTLPAWADLQSGDSTVSLGGGIGFSGSDFDLNGPEKRPITGSGGAMGAQYLRYVRSTPALAIGLDVTTSPNKTLRTEDLLAGYDASARLKSTVVMAMGKLIYPKGPARPYIFAGLGFHSSSLFLSAQPLGGRAWANGGSDNRVLVDEHKTSIALGYGIGMDLFSTDRFFVGLEMRGAWLGGLRRKQTSAAVASGLTMHDDGPVTQNNLLARIGYRW